MHRSLVLLSAVLLGLVAPAAAGAQADRGLSIRLLDAPSDRRDDSRARIYIVDHLRQGDRIERRVELGNDTAEPLDVHLYAAAATVDDGQFRFGEGRAENDLTRWTTLSPSRVTVPAEGRVTSTVTVDVPDDALDGERYAVVWAELPGSGGTASVVNRVGIRMYVSVGEGEEPVTDFRIETLTAARDDDGRPLIRTSVTNTGGRAIDLSGSLLLENGPGSLSAGPFSVELGTTLAPGDRAPAVVHLDETLPDGPWDATVEVRAGELVKEARATINFPDDPGSTAEPVVAESVKQQRRILIPVAAALAIAALVGIVAVALMLLGARRRERSEAQRARP